MFLLSRPDFNLITSVNSFPCPECLHGHSEKWADRGVPTIFPQPIVLAATFDRDHAWQVYNVISDELRAKANKRHRETGASM